MVTLRKFRFDARTFALATLFCVGLFPIVLMLHHVRANWLPLPFWDEWHTPGSQFESWCRGTLTIGELFSQHNESRKFFPRLLYFALASVGGWDPRKEVTVFFLEVCFLAALLWQLLRRTPGSTTLSALITWTVMMFLCFSSVQFGNFLYGIQLEPLFPGVAVVAMASVNLSRLSFRSKTLANLSLAFLATYTFANGMLLWVLGLPLAEQSDSTSRRKRMLWCAIYVFSATLAIACYFIGYKKPSYHPDFASIRNVLDLAHYLILWIGAYFASDYVNPFFFGIVAGAFFVVMMGSAIIPVVRDPQDCRTFYPWLLIGAYALLTGIITAFGRLGFGVQQALDSRYAVLSLFFYLAVVGATFALYCARFRNHTARRACFLTNVAWVSGLGALCWIASYQMNSIQLRLHRHHQAQLLRAIEWMDPIPDNPDLTLILPFVDLLRNRARILAEHRILRLPFITEPLSSQVQQSPPATDGSNGQIETCGFDDSHSLFITGWAWLPAKNQRANCVVIGCRDTSGKFKPMTVLETGARRQDLRDRFHIAEIYHAGFSRTVNPANLLPGAVRIEGWAIDLKNQRALPLASTVTLPTAK
ncbi:MAG: hypothetical protein M3O66_01805 [Verrucomicrobiota bacterium]|nr:hypothetical protein [Verrucomicrobiota bacterium]